MIMTPVVCLPLIYSHAEKDFYMKTVKNTTASACARKLACNWLPPLVVNGIWQLASFRSRHRLWSSAG